MVRIYYESDFKIIEKFAREELVSVPFKYTYYTTTKYEVSWDGKDDYKNCKRDGDGTITAVFNSHGLGMGKLKVRREYFIPDSDFADGIRNEIYVEDTGILLVNGESDNLTVETEVIPPYIYIQEIVDSTEDTSPNKALSANQGKVLNERINVVITSIEVLDNGINEAFKQVNTSIIDNAKVIAEAKAELTATNKDLNETKSELVALEEVVATKADASKVAQVERDVQKNAGAVSNNTARLDVLEGEGEGSVKKAVAGAIAQVVANAPEDFDTLKEVADYIVSDKTKAAEIETSISNLNKKDKAHDDALQVVGNRVTIAEGQITELQGNVSSLQAEVSNVKNDVVPKAVAEGIAQVVANAPTDLDTLKEIADYIASDKTNAAEINNAISALQHEDYELRIATQINYGEIQQVKHDANGTLDLVLDNSRAIQQHTKNIAKNTEDIANHSKAIDKNAKDVVSNTQAINLLAETLETKAPKVGYAPDLKVDFAKELVGRGVAEPQEIGKIRPTGVISIGDGNATIDKIKGKSVVWNQIASVQRMKSYNSNYTTITKGDTYVRVKSKIEGMPGDSFAVRMDDIPSSNIGDVIICMTRFSSTNQSLTPSFEYSSSGIYVNFEKYKDAYSVIYRATSNKNTCLLEATGLKKVDDEWEFRDTIIYNLTKMFGAGNEPTTIEDFEARKPFGIDEYAYNEGEIVSYDAQALKSVGFNAWDEKWEEGIYDVETGRKVEKAGRVRTTDLIKVSNNRTYCTNNYWWSVVLFYDKNKKYISYKYINGTVKTFTTPNDCAYIATYAEEGYGSTYKNDVCINLSHSSYRNGEYQPYEDDTLQLPSVKEIKDKDGNQLFPYGLLSAGSAHDEITATKAVKRIGVVDMGTLNWNPAETSGYNRFSTIVYRMTNNRTNNVLTLKYTTVQYSQGTGLVDKVMVTNNRHIAVVDSGYTDAASLKKSLQGVLLYYELAEPIEVDLEEPLNLTYEAWDFGTEELVAEGKTTPLNADIVYLFNAVDRIRENTAKNQALEAELAELKAHLTQLTQVSNEESGNA